MGDPWTNGDRENLPSTDLISDSTSQVFDDNFNPTEPQQSTTTLQHKHDSFEPLPDSSTYLSNLGK